MFPCPPRANSSNIESQASPRRAVSTGEWLWAPYPYVEGRHRHFLISAVVWQRRPGRDGGASATFYQSNLNSGFFPTRLSNNLATISSRKRCNSFAVLKLEAPVDQTLNLARRCPPPLLGIKPSKKSERPGSIGSDNYRSDRHRTPWSDIARPGATIDQLQHRPSSYSSMLYSFE